MKFIATELRPLLARWKSENSSAAHTAVSTNISRIRWVAPIVAVLNLFHAIAFGWQLFAKDPTGNAGKWTLALFTLHSCMGITMVVVSVVVHQLRFATRSIWVRSLPVALVFVALAFSIAVVTADQWITPSIAPFLLCCLITSVVIYMQPFPSVLVFAVGYIFFFFALGLTQDNAQVLLSNRLNGFVASVMGCTLSTMLWRKFVTITLQQEQLEKANAELQTKQRELERLTRLDGLTGLFNRNTFVELARQELDRAQRQGSDTALLLMDLDHFKRVNDTWGHPAGDAVLRNVASVASRTVRSTDLVGRLGGEEFIVLLPATSVEAARKLAEKLRQRLEASPTTWESSTLVVTASIGVSGCSALEKRNFDSLYTEADKALYLAKTRGRNRVMP